MEGSARGLCSALRWAKGRSLSPTCMSTLRWSVVHDHGVALDDFVGVGGALDAGVVTVVGGDAAHNDVDGAIGVHGVLEDAQGVPAQGVVVAVAEDVVLTGTSEDDVVAVPAGQGVVGRVAVDEVASVTAAERVDVNPAGGADTMRVEDMSGTDTKLVTWELAPFRGTTATDGAADSVLVNGTFGNDTVNVTAAGQQVRVAGLAATVEINRSDPTLDSLHVDTRPTGTDSVTVGPGVHQRLKFTSS